MREEFAAIPGADYNGGRRGSSGDKIQRKPDLLPNYTVGQALSAFHGDPVIAYNEKSKIWIDNESYSKVFKDETSADHIIFTFSLLRAIESRKQELVTKSKSGISLTEQNLKEIEYHRLIGSQFFLMSVVSSCLEVVLNQPTPNKFRLRWSTNDLPNGVILWQPILEIVLSFSQILGENLKDGLKGSEKVRAAESQMRQTLAAIRPYHAEIYDRFAKQALLL